VSSPAARTVPAIVPSAPRARSRTRSWPASISRCRRQLSYPSRFRKGFGMPDHRRRMAFRSACRRLRLPRVDGTKQRVGRRSPPFGPREPAGRWRGGIREANLTGVGRPARGKGSKHGRARFTLAQDRRGLPSKGTNDSRKRLDTERPLPPENPGRGTARYVVQAAAGTTSTSSRCRIPADLARCRTLAADVLLVPEVACRRRRAALSDLPRGPFRARQATRRQPCTILGVLRHPRVVQSLDIDLIRAFAVPPRPLPPASRVIAVLPSSQKRETTYLALPRRARKRQIRVIITERRRGCPFSGRRAHARPRGDLRPSLWARLEPRKNLRAHRRRQWTVELLVFWRAGLGRSRSAVECHVAR